MAPRTLASSLAALVLVAAQAAAGPPAKTMRLDYYHTGNAGTEMFSVDRVVVEPAPWPGNPGRPVDDLNLGKYFFEVRDHAANRVVYSRGFDSVYGEWETTDEAKHANRTFHESLRFPVPGAAVDVSLKKRDARNAFREVWTTVVDPKDRGIDTSAPPLPGPVVEIQKSGDPSGKVDLLMLGEGYTAAERGKCEGDVRRLADGIFTVSPFKERRADFNVWAICAATPEPGVSRPSAGIHRHTLFGSTFSAFGTERYALSFDNRALREVASFAPYDVLAVVMNEKAYGNGGIFGQYASVSIDFPTAIDVFVHEFGHHFAGLADEYYTSDVAYGAAAAREEPWEPNATANPASPKWRDLVTPATPLPTPWSKAEFEAAQKEIQARRRKIRAEKRPEEEMEALFREEQQRVDALLAQGGHARAVGAFEGAMYEATGYFRAEANCIMFTRHSAFCAACRRAIERVIDLYAGPSPR